MIVSSIIKRYSNTYNSPLSIVMTQCDNIKFMPFLKKVLPDQSNILALTDTLFGNFGIDLIICHNKINYLEKCGHLSYFLHCPILVIDYETKPAFIEKDIIHYQSNSIYSVALNDSIYNSWGRTHDLVLSFNIDNYDNIERWRNLLYQIIKIPFSLKPKQNNNAE